MNWIGFWTLFLKELDRTRAVFLQAVLSPVMTTALYFIVFGAAIGSRIAHIGGVPYAAFIVPGLIIMAVIPNALSASSSGIYFLKFRGAIMDLLSAPLSGVEIVSAFALSAMLRALLIGGIIYAIARLFTPIGIAHPFAAIGITLIIALAFATFGVVAGLWADNFDQLAFVPTLILTPLSFLGGVFYSTHMLSPLWQRITLANPVYYMVDSLRWAFFGTATTTPLLSIAITLAFFLLCLATAIILFRTGYKIMA